jgi:hypothetical protein
VRKLADFLRHWWRAVVSILSAVALAAFLVTWLGTSHWQLAGFAALAVASIGLTLTLLSDLRATRQELTDAKATAVARIEQLEVDVAGLRAELESRWVNDGTIPAPEREARFLTPEGKFRWAFRVTTKADLWPIRLRLYLSAPISSAEGEHRSTLTSWEEPLTVTLLDGSTILELWSHETLHPGGELMVYVDAEATADVQVEDVKRYKEG